MKKILFTLCLGCFSIAYTQNLNFTDSKFKALILSSSSANEIAKDLNGNSIAVDANGDGEIQVSEAQQVKILTVKLPNFSSNLVPDNISDATKFTNVEELYINHTNNAVLNYSNNSKIKKVKFIYIGDVMPNTINYSFDNCSGLQNLNDVITSPYTSSYPPSMFTTAQILTIKNCSQVNGNQNIQGRLAELYVENSPITNLIISVVTEFTKLSVPNLNTLENIELISGYYFYYPQGTELIANNCSNLQQITTSGTSYYDSMVYFSSINVDGCYNLKKIKGLNYQNIDFSTAGLVNLEELDCAFYNRYVYSTTSGIYFGNVSSLNLAGLPNLKILKAFNQPITNNVNFIIAPLLQNIDITNSCGYMNTVDVSNLANLDTLTSNITVTTGQNGNIDLQKIIAKNCPVLVNLKIYGNFNLKELDLENCPGIQSLIIDSYTNSYGNVFSNLNLLNIINCNALEELRIGYTKITDLNTQGCTALKSLDIHHNSLLSQINISTSSNLEYLFFYQLPLITQLNSSNNTNIKNISFNYCPQITQLDFSNASDLENFSFVGMVNLTSLSVKNGSIEQGYEFANYNNNLSVCVDDAQLADLQSIYPDINFITDCSNLITTVWNGATWNNGTPHSAITAIIDGPYSTTSNPSFTAKNIIVNQGDFLEITSGNTINTVDIKIKDGGSLIQKDGSSLTYSGVFRVLKNGTSEIDKYAFWSSPVASQNLSIIYGQGNTPQFITEYNTATDYFVNAASTTSVFGKGYSIKTPVSYAALLFEGAPNNGTQTFNLSTAGNRFNLVGNPYPSNLDLNVFFNTNSNRISNTFYFWDNQSNSVTTQNGSSTTNIGYATYNPLTSTWAPAPNISTVPAGTSADIGQGFIVQALNTSVDPALTFNNDMRVSDDGAFFNKNNTAGEGKFWLRLNSSYNTSNTFAVVYLNAASDAFDNYDSQAIAIGSDAFYTIADAQKLIIQGKASFDTGDVVAVGAKHFESGNFTVSLAQKEGIFNNGQAIYLHDKLLNTYTDLQNGPYSFAANAGEFTDRFEIVYQLNVLSASETLKDAFKVYRDGEDFFVRNDKNIKKIEIFDASGRKIQEINAESKLVRIQLDSKGVYILKATSQNKEYTRKLIK